jgi:hypothetical protein
MSTSHFGAERGGRDFCGFYLAVLNALLIAGSNFNKYRIITYIFDMKKSAEMYVF